MGHSNLPQSLVITKKGVMALSVTPFFFSWYHYCHYGKVQLELPLLLSTPHQNSVDPAISISMDFRICRYFSLFPSNQFGHVSSETLFEKPDLCRKSGAIFKEFMPIGYRLAADTVFIGSWESLEIATELETYFINLIKNFDISLPWGSPYVFWILSTGNTEKKLLLQ